MKTRRIIFFLTLNLSIIGVASAAFPLAILPGVALLFDSGAMAVGYATTLALVGGLLSWVYLSPSDPPANQAPATKLEVRMNEDEASNISRPPSVVYEDYGSGERHMYPPETTTMAGSFSNTAQYNAHVDQIQKSYRCTVASGCNEVIVTTGQIWWELAWVHQSADRYLRVVTATNATYKIDPHNVASRDGANEAAFTICPSGYEFVNGNTCRIEDIYSLWYLPSDGICSYTTDSNGKFIIDPAAYSAYVSNRIVDPDCYAKVNKVDKLEYQVNPDQKITLEAVNPTAIKITEEKKNQDNTVDKSEYIFQKSGDDMKLTGGAYNNAFDNSNPGSGNGNNNGEGGGACGAAGLPPCEIDDSGFSGAGNFDDSEIDNAIQSNLNAVGNVDGLDMSISFLPGLLPGNPVPCKPIPFNLTFRRPLIGITVSDGIDICPYLDVVRDIFSYLFGLGAVIYIWRRFSRANDGA
jgi:hypothetical protein